MTPVVVDVGVLGEPAFTPDSGAVEVAAVAEADLMVTCDAALAVRDDIVVVCHSRPIATPEDAQYIFEHTEGINGFFGVSSIERLSVEPAIEGQARAFKELKLP